LCISCPAVCAVEPMVMNGVKARARDVTHRAKREVFIPYQMHEMPASLCLLTEVIRFVRKAKQ